MNPLNYISEVKDSVVNVHEFCFDSSQSNKYNAIRKLWKGMIKSQKFLWNYMRNIGATKVFYDRRK
jgi:hypothetical protein